MDQYSYRPARKRNKTAPTSRYLRDRVIARDGGACVYCGYPADSVDHVIPWSFGGADAEDNLVACCMICNLICKDRMFASLQEKVAWVREQYGPFLEKRAKIARKRLTICADCGAIYNSQQRGATAVLCKACYKRDEDGLNGTLR